jgi:V/A-type H+/Na+-transporting ATPase subunit K
MGYILAMIGLGIMVGLSGSGSAMGLQITGSALLGALKKKPDAFGICLVPFAMPATQGLYGFVGFILYNSPSLINANMSVLSGAVILGAGVAMGLACLISAIKQGQICADGIAAIGSGHNVFGNTVILGAFPEFYAILSLVAAILMKNLIS